MEIPINPLKKKLTGYDKFNQMSKKDKESKYFKCKNRYDTKVRNLEVDEYLVKK